MHLKSFSRGVLESVFSLSLMFSSTTFGPPQQGRGHDPDIPEAIPIVVSPDGFLQRTLSIPNGSYVFVIVNRTGLWDITVSLERMTSFHSAKRSLQEPAAAALAFRPCRQEVFNSRERNGTQKRVWTFSAHDICRRHSHDSLVWTRV